jgi:hypothetical protein
MLVASASLRTAMQRRETRAGRGGNLELII